MPTTPLILFGGAWLLVAAYTYSRANAEFDSSMALRGVDPDAIDADARDRGTRRNRQVSLVVALLGVACIVAGLIV